MPTPAALASALVSALFRYGSPARLALDPDSQREVAHGVAAQIGVAARAIGSDRAALDATRTRVRVLVSARSESLFDEGQADRICRGLYRAWMTASRGAEVSL